MRGTKLIKMAVAIACAVGLARVAEAGGKEARRAERARHAQAQRKGSGDAAASSSASRRTERGQHKQAMDRRAANAGEDQVKPATTQPAPGRPYLTPADEAFKIAPRR